MNRTAVITGASSGIGAATARRLRRDGWEVVGVARRADRLADLAAEIGMTMVPADLTDPGGIATLREALEPRGGIQALVNNAGGAIGADTVETAVIDEWRTMYEVNVLATQQVTAALLPLLRAGISGPGDTTSIVTVTSTAGHSSYEGGGGYVAAKHAAAGMMAVLRLELAGEPIRVIEIAPGMVHTDEFALVRYRGDRARADAVYAGVEAPLTAADIADAIAFTLNAPPHVNIDQMTIRPVAQAANHKVIRGPLRPQA